jgi:two-component system sensor histidine kinase KdpD
VPFGQGTAEPGVLRISGVAAAPPLANPSRLLRAFADEARLALHRAVLSNEAARTEALERAGELKSVLLSSVSHDLRSPLTAIKAAVGSLRDPAVHWSQQDEAVFLETIESQTDRLTTTVTNILEMSRLEGHAVRAVLERVEIAPLLYEVELAQRAVTAGRVVIVTAPRELWVLADYGLLFQALGNLIENAAKYSVPGGGISLSARSLPGRIQLYVSDSGPGIPPGNLPHLFEKFYRGSTSTTIEGTGLGLAIVKAMIELCHGTIRVASSQDGSVFTIELPATERP